MPPKRKLVWSRSRLVAVDEMVLLRNVNWFLSLIFQSKRLKNLFEFEKMVVLPKVPGSIPPVYDLNAAVISCASCTERIAAEPAVPAPLITGSWRRDNSSLVKKNNLSLINGKPT